MSEQAPAENNIQDDSKLVDDKDRAYVMATNGDYNRTQVAEHRAAGALVVSKFVENPNHQNVTDAVNEEYRAARDASREAFLAAKDAGQENPSNFVPENRVNVAHRASDALFEENSPETAVRRLVHGLKSNEAEADKREEEAGERYDEGMKILDSLEGHDGDSSETIELREALKAVVNEYIDTLDARHNEVSDNIANEWRDLLKKLDQNPTGADADEAVSRVRALDIVLDALSDEKEVKNAIARLQEQLRQSELKTATKKEELAQREVIAADMLTELGIKK